MIVKLGYRYLSRNVSKHLNLTRIDWALGNLNIFMLPRILNSPGPGVEENIS